MTDAAFKLLVDWRLYEASLALGHPLPVTWDVGSFHHFSSARGFGVTLYTEGEPTARMRFARKLRRQPLHRVEGVVRHEIGHAVDHLAPAGALDAWALGRSVILAKTPERRADDIAYAIWYRPISYDAQLVQSTSEGVMPRPAHLGL